MASIKRQNADIIRSPIITEKAAMVKASGNAVVFAVHPRANKLEIRRAVEKIYNVNVIGVRTCRSFEPVGRTAGKRSSGRNRQWKKAYVTLAAGSSIGVVEGL